MSRRKRAAQLPILAAGLFALLFGAPPAVARTVALGSCSVTVPDNWNAGAGAASSPNGRVDVRLRETIGAMSLQLERASPGVAVQLDNGALVVLRTAAANGASRYFAVVPRGPQPACSATVTSRIPAGDGAAANVAASLRRGAAAAASAARDDGGDGRDGRGRRDRGRNDREDREGREDREDDRGEDRDDFRPD